MKNFLFGNLSSKDGYLNKQETYIFNKVYKL